MSILRNYHSKYIVLRINFLQKILNKAHIKRIGDHWVLVKDLNNQSIIIDLGSNKGVFTKQIQALYQSQCYAIEANADLYELLLEEKITAFNYAVTAANGPIEFYISTNAEASSLINNFENVWGLEKKVTVEGISFQSLLKKLHLENKVIEIVKIDIEGAELELIESLNDDDVKNIKQITIEFHDWINKALHERTVAAIKKLINLGFSAYTDTPHHNNAVEMLFLNQRLMDAHVKASFYLKLYKYTTFLKYR